MSIEQKPFELKSKSQISRLDVSTYQNSVPRDLAVKGILYIDDLKNKLFYNVQSYKDVNWFDLSCEKLTINELTEDGKIGDPSIMGIESKKINSKSRNEINTAGQNVAGAYGIYGSFKKDNAEEYASKFQDERVIFEFKLVPKDTTKVAYLFEQNEWKNFKPEYDDNYDILIIEYGDEIKITPRSFKLNGSNKYRSDIVKLVSIEKYTRGMKEIIFSCLTALDESPSKLRSIIKSMFGEKTNITPEKIIEPINISAQDGSGPFTDQFIQSMSEYFPGLKSEQTSKPIQSIPTQTTQQAPVAQTTNLLSQPQLSESPGASKPNQITPQKTTEDTTKQLLDLMSKLKSGQITPGQLLRQLPGPVSTVVSKHLPDLMTGHLSPTQIIGRIIQDLPKHVLESLSTPPTTTLTGGNQTYYRKYQKYKYKYLALKNES